MIFIKHLYMSGYYKRSLMFDADCAWRAFCHVLGTTISFKHFVTLCDPGLLKNWMETVIVYHNNYYQS